MALAISSFKILRNNKQSCAIKLLTPSLRSVSSFLIDYLVFEECLLFPQSIENLLKRLLYHVLTTIQNSLCSTHHSPDARKCDKGNSIL